MGWADALQGAGAWFSGNGPQYQYAKAQEQETAFLKDEKRREALIKDVVYANAAAQAGRWDTVQGLLQNRMENIGKLKGDPYHTQGLLEMASDPNRRQEFLDETNAFIQAGVLAGDLQLPESVGMASAKTRQFVDGTVQMVLPDGSVSVVLPNGQRVAGEQAQAALQQAMANEVAYAGQKSGAMAGAQQDARYQYAAPIAGAEAGARASVEAATAPRIAADVTAAEEGAKATAELKGQQRSNSLALDTYNAAMSELESSLRNTETGPVAGRIPAVTANAQIAEGTIAAIAPVLKQLFRSAGEGVFTDKDQALLMDMIPKRTDHPETIAAKKANIDAIVRAKLGGSPSVLPAARSGGPVQGAVSGGFKVLKVE